MVSKSTFISITITLILYLYIKSYSIPEHADDLKRAAFHTTMQCTDCHSPGSFGQDDPYRHNATTLACAACHQRLPQIEDRKPFDHSDFNPVRH
ncbi:MAG: hypothetical protein Q8P40_07290 [Nitrospirota bacterium]|nr:hypothetical protein [Nitrospirota bacterium]